MTIKRLGGGPRMSQAVIHGGTVCLAGQVADDPVPSVAEQTRQILAKIDKLLMEAGTDKSKLLSANIWHWSSNPLNACRACSGKASSASTSVISSPSLPMP